MLEIVYFFICFVILIYAAIMALRTIRFVLFSRRAFLYTKPFNRDIKNAQEHILILGDSSMYGAGILKQRNTIGGLLTTKYPKATIETCAVNGSQVRDLKKQLEGKKYGHYDIILIGIGGNDIVRFSNFNSLRIDLLIFLKSISKISDRIILCHSVNIGNIGFYLFPLDYIFDRRSRKLSQIYAAIKNQFPNLIYVNFYKEKGNDYYDKTTRKKFLAADGVHPNDYANKYFFNIIWNELQKNKIKNKHIH